MKPTSRPNGEAAALTKIAVMAPPFSAMGERRTTYYEKIDLTRHSNKRNPYERR